MDRKIEKDIFNALGVKRIGRISEYLKELELSGFIARDYTWDIKKHLDSELSRYRLSDNYLRFYFNYIKKNLSKIARNTFALKSITSLPEWNIIMGLQFENLILNNRSSIHKILHINPEDIICDNPFFQRTTNRMAGCQIDYMIQTKFGTLYICEIKFCKTVIGTNIIQEVQDKIDKLSVPKGFSYRPVLIHVNGVTEEVVDRDYFCKIIDMETLLNIT